MTKPPAGASWFPASPTMMGEYLPYILLAFFGFILLAYLLLAPVYRFLQREEKASREWTKESIARRYREEPPAN